MEGVLPGHERAACLAHFAECAACREVVYLLEESTPAEPPVAAAADRAWWKPWLKPLLSATAATGIAAYRR